MRRASHFIPTLVLLLWALGCASTPAVEDDDAAGLDLAAAEIEADLHTDEVGDNTGADAQEVAEAPPEPPIDPAFVVGPPAEIGNLPAVADSELPSEQETPADSGAASFWRADGRPAWWLAAPRREDGRVTVTAEAIGVDLGDARAKALGAGRAALQRICGPAPGGEKIESLIVRRLDSDAPGRARYVGYARLSAREPEPLSP